MTPCASNQPAQFLAPSGHRSLLSVYKAANDMTHVFVFILIKQQYGSLVLSLALHRWKLSRRHTMLWLQLSHLKQPLSVACQVLVTFSCQRLQPCHTCWCLVLCNHFLTWFWQKDPGLKRFWQTWFILQNWKDALIHSSATIQKKHSNHLSEAAESTIAEAGSGFTHRAQDHCLPSVFLVFV